MFSLLSCEHCEENKTKREDEKNKERQISMINQIIAQGLARHAATHTIRVQNHNFWYRSLMVQRAKPPVLKKKKKEEEEKEEGGRRRRGRRRRRKRKRRRKGRRKRRRRTTTTTTKQSTRAKART